MDNGLYKEDNFLNNAKKIKIFKRSNVGFPYIHSTVRDTDWFLLDFLLLFKHQFSFGYKRDIVDDFNTFC